MRQARRTRRLAGALGAAALVVAAGCGSKDPTGPTFTGTGSYELVSYDGHTLPYTFPDSVVADLRVLDGSLAFQSTSATTGTGKWCERLGAVSDTSKVSSVCVDFNWTRAGQTLSFNYATGYPSTAAVVGGFIDLGIPASDLSRTLILRFRKKG